MSNLSKNETLAKLTELQGNLNELETAKREIASCEAAIQNLDNMHPTPNLLRTDLYASKRKEFADKKAEHRSRRFFLTIGLVFLGICLLMLVIGEFLYIGPDWSTPEIVGEYSGNYYYSYANMNATLTIASCNKKGEIEGTFEFSGEENTLLSSLYGKYSIEGKVQKKGENGEIIATIEFDEWIERPDGIYPLEDMEIKIYDNYSTVQNLDYEMILCTEGTEIPADFVSPEIEGNYQKDGGEHQTLKNTVAVVVTLCYFAFVIVWAIIVFGTELLTFNKE